MIRQDRAAPVWFHGVAFALAAFLPAVPRASASELSCERHLSSAGDSVITCSDTEGSEIRLLASAHRDVPEGGQLDYLLTRNGQPLLEAHLCIDDEGVAFAGWADGTAFEWRSRTSGDGSILSRRVWRDVDLRTAVRSGGGPAGGVRVVSGDPETYLAAVRIAERLEAFELMHDIGDSVPELSPRLRAARLAAAGLLLQTDAKSPIGGYLECLEDSCNVCSGCWKGGCHCCNGDPVWACTTIWTCYLFGSDLCLLKQIDDLKPDLW